MRHLHWLDPVNLGTEGYQYRRLPSRRRQSCVAEAQIENAGDEHWRTKITK
jgi:hypothetical protein